MSGEFENSRCNVKRWHTERHAESAHPSCPWCKLAEADAEIATLRADLERARKLAEKVRTHRNVPCVNSEFCRGLEECDLLDHQHLVYKTKQARDDMEALLDALSPPPQEGL